MAERYYFHNSYVEVTKTRAVFGSKSYSINGITSTEVVESRPRRLIPILLLLTGLAFGLCCGMSTLGMQIGPDKEDTSPALVAGGFAIFGVASAILVTHQLAELHLLGSGGSAPVFV